MSFATYLEAVNAEIDDIKPIKISGRVTSVKGVVIECQGISEFVSIGSRCKVNNPLKNSHILCEVVGFENSSVLLMPFDDTEGVGAGAEVEVYQHENVIHPDESWLGRIVNAFGEPIDEIGPLKPGERSYPLKTNPPPSQKRNRIGKKIDLGVKVIDTFMSCCFGQRMGIFAGSGVGKSVLISMLTKYAATDVKVIGLIGERGREAKEFIEEYLGPEGLKKAVIIMATGDESALLRKRAAYVTMAVAEYFRDQGKEVLCIMDSVTRFAMAQREIGLAVGEPPTTKGYPPSVFSELPKILERAGPGVNKANITGLFTVLVEGDDQNEPISDAVRGILDGHIVLDRAIAERGRFPAVDVLRSVSRALPQCNNDLENKQITYARKMLATYQDMAEMIRLGAYKKGTDPEVDLSIGYFDKIEKFLNQKPNESCAMDESYKQLGAILGITE
ncbi:flagellar protein export ATPase FliI [Rickettsiaceae bacterium]|nr:flagellar protein export ATPase FliI [Rickettsiaceae bacterium]